jgi:hypothetical protein
MADLTELSASAVSGGLFGMLGTVFGRLIGIFERREARKDRAMEIAHDEKRWGHEKDLLALQAQARAAETEQELLLADARGSWAALTASQQAEASIAPSYRWVDAVRALTRPVLTLLLALGLYLTFLTAGPDLKARVAESLAFAATAAILWWFGDRAPRRAPGG